MIDRIKVKKTFKDYIDNYDAKDPKVALKIAHTYRVADICQDIALSEGCMDKDVDIAWLLGMFHDIGRFEQLRRYGTFSDADSIDHAQLSADLLFVDGLADDYVPGLVADRDSGEGSLIEKAIRLHNVFRIPTDLTAREAFFCNLLRDADKIDIFRVNIDTPPEDIYNVSTEELYSSRVSDSVLRSFTEGHATLRSDRKTAVDFLAAHTSLSFELVYRRSWEITREQGYLDKMLDFPSRNPKTREQFAWMKEQIYKYFDRKYKI